MRPDEMRHTDGCTSHLDGSVIKMREMLLKGREGVPRIGVVLASDVAVTSRVTAAQAQCQSAIREDNVNVLAVGQSVLHTLNSLIIKHYYFSHYCL